MKKLFIGVAVVLLVVLSGVYIFVPGRITLSKITVIDCTINGTYRYLSDEGKWWKWWKDTDQNTAYTAADRDRFFSFHSDRYHITKKYPYAVEVSILHHGISYPSVITLLSLGEDSLAAQWVCPVTSSGTWNPVERIRLYREAKNIRSNMSDVLQNLHAFLENKANVYGSLIEKRSTKDTLLVSTKTITTGYPGTTEIYNLINSLKKYLSKEDASQTGYPMVNILKMDSGKFQLMVALPANKALPGTDIITPKRMVPGNFLVTEIQGGPYIINETLNQLQLYVQDYKKTVMAIPFQYLITDRTKESDTTKWVTRVYMPIMR